MPTLRSKDFPDRLLSLLYRHIPPPLESWSLAMIAEMSAIDRFWPRLQWSLGSTSALLSSLWCKSGYVGKNL